ncbi:hypothetical protein G9C98_004292 [Cotesia typhae]|uniref:Exosome complex component RRP42 n=1 Tax=Cotesia typhae TaxID=2053667 RepID=A0A8J5QY41_9HYME|nr:hypothetical protein G9C98_004292 [Cotesia typhae]
MENPLSLAEKTFILHGVDADLRIDGRRQCEYRSIEIETKLMPQTNGSARLKIGNTDVLVGKGGDDLATEISNVLTNTYQSQKTFNLKFLSILPHKKCWKMYVDVLILQCGGNLYDAIGAAIKAALFNTELPRVTAATLDGGEADLQVSDDPFDCVTLNVESFPVLVTLCKIGDNCIVDPIAEEEACAAASVVLSNNHWDLKDQSLVFYVSKIKSL